MSKIAQLKPGVHYSNEDIFETFLCSPQGGMRRSKRTNTLVLIANHAYSIYKDRWNDGVLNYTGMGKKGNQVLDGNQNITLFESDNNGIEVHLFEVFSSTRIYTYKGQVQLADKPFIEKQDDFDGWSRDVWVFPLKLIDSTTIDTNDKEQENSIEVDEVSEVNLKSISLEFFVEKYDVLVRVRNSIVAEATNSDLGTLGTLHDFISSNELRENLLKMPNFGKTSLINLKDCINELIENERLLKEFANICNNTSESLDTSESLKDLNSIEEMLEYEISNLGNKEKAILKSRNLHKPILTLEAIGKTIGLTRERVRQINSKSLRKIRYSLTYKKYNKKDLAYYFKEELDNFFFSENSFISLKTAKECLKTEPEPTSIQLFIQIMSNNLNNFLNVYYMFNENYNGWFIDEEHDIKRLIKDDASGLDLEEALLKSGWPIKLSSIAENMGLPEEVALDAVLLSKKLKIYKIDNEIFIKYKKLTSSTAVRLALGNFQDGANFIELQQFIKDAFNLNLSIRSVSANLDYMSDSVMIERAQYSKYILFDNLNLDEEKVDSIKQFTINYLMKRQEFISAAIIFKNLLKDNNSFTSNPLMSSYVLYEICKVDNRFINGRGAMLGLNNDEFKGEFTPLMQEYVNLMIKFSRPLTVSEIIKELSSKRDLLEAAVYTQLNNDTHNVFVRIGNGFYLKDIKNIPINNRNELWELEFDDI